MVYHADGCSAPYSQRYLDTAGRATCSPGRATGRSRPTCRRRSPITSCAFDDPSVLRTRGAEVLAETLKVLAVHSHKHRVCLLPDDTHRGPSAHQIVWYQAI